MFNNSFSSIAFIRYDITQSIHFYKEDRELQMYEGSGELIVDVPLLKAIIKQCEELGWLETKPKDYWANITAIKDKQTKKGIDTYGQTLEENTAMSIIERLEYLEEELVDGLMYIEHIKEKVK